MCLHRLWIPLSSILLFDWLAISAQAAITVTPEEMAEKSQWVQQNLLTAANVPPFFFSYNGTPSSSLLSSWSRSEKDTVLDLNRTQHVINWSNGIVQVSCVAVEYNDYPVVEWTVYLKDISSANTPILQNIEGLNITITRTNGPEFVLNGNQGDSDSSSSYQPFQTTLSPSTVRSYSPPSGSGKSCDSTGWPYFNLQTPGGGMIMAIGWPGQWSSFFTRDSGNDLQIQAGQQTTYMYLKPGEQIRTPLIALLFWQGSSIVRSQNLWRHWYMAHVIPLVSNEPPATMWVVTGDNVSALTPFIQAGIQPDILWRDAGGDYTWYPSSNGPYTGNDAYLNTGTWDVDVTKYPQGFLATSQAANAEGAKFLLWFEPERIGNTTSSFLATNNTSWVLPATSSTVGAILNEGNTGAFNWLTNHIQNLIVSNGINWYREDMNGGGPLPAWQENDPPNRQGITENFYVQNHLAYWDALLAMNPGLRIDCCGSGGRRNDLEAMRRSVPLWRSDDNGIEDSQDQTYALSSWLPYTGTADGDSDSYGMRSHYAACYRNYSPTFSPILQAYTEDHKLAPIMLNGDYYPLTPYSNQLNQWIAWQFDWPATGQGFIQAFRRANSPTGSMTFQLQGLNPTQYYVVQDFDRGDLGWISGGNLMTTGLTVQLNARQSAIIYYTNAVGIKISATVDPEACFGQENFTATGLTGNGAPLTYRWTFGDGSTSTNQNPTHIYAPGRYLAEVTASDGLGGSNMAQVPVTVLSPVGQMMKISFVGYSRSETLTNFPALVELGTNLADNGFAYSHLASSNGWDLVFFNSNQTQVLNYEIEKWNTQGTSFIWVQVPQLNSNTVIWAHWGDANLASVPAPCLTNGSVWANGYEGVWHFANGTTLSGADSSPNADNGVINKATPTTGVIDGAASFNGANSYIDAGTANPMANQAITMSAWVYPSGGPIIMMKGNDGTAQSYGLEWSGNNSLLFTFADTTDWLQDGGVCPAGQWSHVTGIIDGNSKYLYVNGLLRATNTFSGRLYPNNASFWLGAQNRPSYNYYFGGALDEARVASLARSSNWVWAEYMTMASNQVFNGYGVAEAYAFPPSPVSLTATASPLYGIVPMSVQFSGNAIAGNGTSVTYNWHFGDGGASTNQNPVHVYEANGKYLVEVTAVDAYGNSSSLDLTVMATAPQKTMPIGFSGYSRNETLSNFPVMVEFGTNLSARGFSYSQMGSSNGLDLMFLCPGQIEPLNYEIEKWDTNGTSYVWVQVPLLNSNTVVQAFWGDTNLAGVPAPSTTNGSVWANGYVSVWHLGETNGMAYDSTGNHGVGSLYTTYGTCMQGVDGLIGAGCAFGGGYISTSASLLPTGTNPRTVSAWFKKGAASTASPGEEILGYGDNTYDGDRFGLWIGGNGTAANALAGRCKTG